MSSYTITKKNKLEEVKNIIVEAVEGPNKLYPNYKYYMRVLMAGQDPNGPTSLHSLSSVNIRSEGIIKGPITPHTNMKKIGKDAGVADVGPKKPCVEMRISDDGESKFASIHDYLDISHRLAWIAYRCGLNTALPNALALTYRQVSYEFTDPMGEKITCSGHEVLIVLKDGSIKPLVNYIREEKLEKGVVFINALKAAKYCESTEDRVLILGAGEVPSKLFSTKKAGKDAVKDQYTVNAEFYLPKGVKQRSSDATTPMSPQMATPEYWGINIPLVTEINGQRRIATIDNKRLNWIDLEKIRKSCPDLPSEIAKHQNCVVIKDPNTVGGYFIGDIVYHISGVMSSNGSRSKTHYTIEALCKLPGEASVGQNADLYDSYEVKTAPVNRFSFEPQEAPGTAAPEKSLIEAGEEE